jgi:hypothetical protein
MRAHVYAFVVHVCACVRVCVHRASFAASVAALLIPVSVPIETAITPASKAHPTKVSMIESAGMSVKDGRGQASGGDRRGGKGQILRGEFRYAVRACGRSGKQFQEPILVLERVLLED